VTRAADEAIALGDSDEVPVWLGFSRGELRDELTVRVGRG
jgi:hypothetical protein